jgi:hypothetical protein
MAIDKFRLKGNKYVIDKDPNSHLDYTLDFSDFLTPVGDSIASVQVFVEGGLVVDLITNTTLTATAWLSGGDITQDGDYASATFRITTSHNPPRIEDRTVYFNVLQR